MRYRLIVRPEAKADIKDSYRWYEDQVDGLGKDFRKELRRTIFLIKTNPLGFPKVHRSTRRALVNRFPHAFFFFVDGEQVIVTSCVHHKRHPRTWKRRR